MKNFYVKDANAVVVPKEEIQKKGGVVVLSLEEYRKLLEQAVPTYQLYGKEAEEADELVREGMQEYKAGKTTKIKSLSDLD
jgi:PHD/YefM family antitoxin component YafN of YafNO toxin-antitoxin module